MSVRIVRVLPQELEPYRDGLHQLEQDILYPIGDGADHFYIDHGERYEAFFCGLGEAQFLLALDGDRVVGTFSGVLRHARIGERRVPTIYGADFKIAKAYRGGGLSGRYLWRGFLASLQALPRWRIAYAAAMRGSRGDVMRSARGLSPLRFGRPAARLAIYFAAPDRLASLDPSRCPPPPREGGLDLSPDPACRPPGLISTEGRKDLRLVSTGQPWPLVHLPRGPSSWTPSWGHYLRACGAALVGSGASACFAIDERLRDHVDWLASAGVEPGAVCTVYTLRLPGTKPLAPWLHLATCEI
jgi:hypothetical protein